MILKSLRSFGRVDAESDRGLSEFFIETPAYTEIENQQRLVVTGRKGAGKTAIYSMLLERSTSWSNLFAVGLDFRDYPWDLHDAACFPGSSSAERYAPLWQFLILIELAKLAVREPPRDTNKEIRKAHKALKRFVKRNWGRSDGGVRETFARSNYNLTIEPRAFGVSLFSLRRERVPRERLAASLGGVNAWLRRSLTVLLDRNDSYFVLLDDLDSGFGADDAAARDRLVGLLIAARELRLWAQKEGQRFTPVVFMRSDIYAALHFPSKNKINAGELERISWSEQESHPASLKALIEQRIVASIDYATEEPWAEIFAPDQIGEQTLYAFMATRTHRRPRDMIHLANLCLQCANLLGAEKIGAEHLRDALPGYSEYLLSEIGDAAHQFVPDWDEHLMTLRRLGQRSFQRAAFEAEHARGNSTQSVDHALRNLYDFGGIGYLQGESVVFAHHNDARLDTAAPSFEVHPGLCEALELATRRRVPSRDRAAGGDTDQA